MVFHTAINARSALIIVALSIVSAFFISQLKLPSVNKAIWKMEHAETRAIALHEHIFAQPQETYANKPWALVQAIEDFAAEKGMMTFKKGKLDVSRRELEKMQPPPQTLLEFGTYVGSSAIAWGAILRELNPGSQNCRVYTFELETKMANIARDFVRLAGMEDTVHVLEGPASESLKKLFEEGTVKQKGIDVAFFDHYDQFYKPDLQLCEDLGLFRLGSMAIADNVDFPGAPEYRAYVEAGGRQEKGSVRYETQSLESELSNSSWPTLVEVSTVVAGA